MGKRVFTGAKIFDGHSVYHDHGLLVSGGAIAGLCRLEEVPPGYEEVVLAGGVLSPGFHDLQVNGGGGVLFNEHPTLEGIETICNAHMQYGTTGLLPTLITDTPEVTAAAIDAGIKAHSNGVAGFLGLHLEGPHLSFRKKGAHDPSLIRTMHDDDCEQLISAKSKLPNMMVTVAPESVCCEYISRLSQAGIIVSLGHTGATIEQVRLARRAGASCITHLYNAMSPLTHQEPGMVGAALAPLGFHCGIIADGFHVDPVVMAISLAAKTGSGNLFLVSDSMSTVGADITEFELNGRTIYRKQGRLTLADGTLAGADLELGAAVRFMVNSVGVELAEALRMATLYPLRALNIAVEKEHFAQGKPANLVWINDDLLVQRVWYEGRVASDFGQ